MLKIGLLALLWLPSSAYAEGAKAFQPQAIFQDEGDQVIPYSVQCASTSWTVLVSSNIISRSVLYVALSGNSTSICISSMTTAGYACQDSTPGIELTPGSSLSDYTKVVWYCRARQTVGATDTRGYIKGRRSRDSGDDGYNR